MITDAGAPMMRPMHDECVGAGGGTRTHGLTITNRLRFQLRHTGLHATLLPTLSVPGHDEARTRGSLLHRAVHWQA